MTYHCTKPLKLPNFCENHRPRARVFCCCTMTMSIQHSFDPHKLLPYAFKGCVLCSATWAWLSFWLELDCGGKSCVSVQRRSAAQIAFALASCVRVWDVPPPEVIPPRGISVEISCINTYRNSRKDFRKHFCNNSLRNSKTNFRRISLKNFRRISLKKF